MMRRLSTGPTVLVSILILTFHTLRATNILSLHSIDFTNAELTMNNSYLFITGIFNILVELLLLDGLSGTFALIPGSLGPYYFLTIIILLLLSEKQQDVCGAKMDCDLRVPVFYPCTCNQQEHEMVEDRTSIFDLYFNQTSAGMTWRWPASTRATRTPTSATSVSVPTVGRATTAAWSPPLSTVRILQVITSCGFKCPS